jgi:hypothetical protein
VAKYPAKRAEVSPGSRVKEANGLKEAWLKYRRKHLNHVDPKLTDSLDNQSADHNQAELSQTPRWDFVYPSENLAPPTPKTAGIGLSSELTPGTPFWFGYDSFVSGESRNAHAVNFSDFASWGFQIRAPLEDELGERPVGAAFDLGVTLPVSLTNLVDLTNSVDVYFGLRGRAAYQVASVFKTKARHVVELGFGGAGIDVVVAKQFWLSVDYPRKMYRFDSGRTAGDNRNSLRAWEGATLSVSAGAALDAF